MLLNFASMIAKRKKYITLWLYSGLFMVILILIVGGVTRITNSGLSITHWSPIGDLPTEENMINSYKSWQESPQGKELKYPFQEFKPIYFWEYLHRLLTRVMMMMIYIIPFIIFIWKKWITKK